jgi:hypothetical protein
MTDTVIDVAEIARRVRAAKDYDELLDVIIDQMLGGQKLREAADAVVRWADYSPAKHSACVPAPFMRALEAALKAPS